MKKAKMGQQDQLLDRFVASFEKLDEMAFFEDIEPVCENSRNQYRRKKSSGILRLALTPAGADRLSSAQDDTGINIGYTRISGA